MTAKLWSPDGTIKYHEQFITSAQIHTNEVILLKIFIVDVDTKDPRWKTACRIKSGDTGTNKNNRGLDNKFVLKDNRKHYNLVTIHRIFITLLEQVNTAGLNSKTDIIEKKLPNETGVQQ